MPKDEDTNALHLISDILDKLIDSQQSNAETNAALKKTVEEAVRELDNINRHFSNGFKAELKLYIDQALDKRLPTIEKHFDDKFSALDKDVDNYFQQMYAVVGEGSMLNTIDAIKEDVEEIKETQHSWWHWIKHSVFIIVGFGTAIGATIKVIQWIQEVTQGSM